MSLTLVVLAAGMGSRYGGLKQVDPVGPGGETLLDYAVFDALRAGFGRVVFVIRRDFDAVFREKVGHRYAHRVDVAYAYQSVETLPAGLAPVGGREKPWGTGHAVWCARDVVDDAFAVINADDFYGADSFRKLAAFLRGAKDATSVPEFALVGFRLANTLSEHGSVSRGVCTVAADGALKSIIEQTSITGPEVGPGRRFTGDEVVSMNCWGFTLPLFAGLDRQLHEFFAAIGKDMKAEFYLPAAVSTMVARGEARVRVLPTESTWFGITYRDDRPRVGLAIAELVRRGEYPERLF